MLLILLGVAFAGLNGDLLLYVHPRYSVFSIVFTLLASFIVIKSIFQQESHSHTRENKFPYLLFICAVIMLFLPARQLSASLAENRQEIVAKTEESSTIFDRFSGDLTRFTIKDWSAALNSPSADQVLGKKAKISGFVGSTADIDSFPRFELARYQLTCCAVDARPITVYVLANTVDRSLVKSGEWLEIEGSFERTADGQFALSPSTVKQISERRTHMSISRFKIVIAVTTFFGLFFTALALSNGPHVKRFIADRKNGLVDTSTRQLIFESSVNSTRIQ